MINYFQHSKIFSAFVRDSLIIALSAIIFFSTKNSYAQKIETGSLEFDEITRDYIVFLPHNLQSNMPVIFVLHGWTEDADYIMGYTRMNEIADTAGFIAVYPNSAGSASTKRWNMFQPDLDEPNVDDVGFISAIIDTLYSLYDIDLSRIYLSGYSNGGRMSYYLVWKLGHRFSSVANIAGRLNYDMAADYNPLRSFPILKCHGTLDNYEGVSSKMPVEEELRFWLEHNNCALESDTVFIPDKDPSDNCTVVKISYTNCEDEIMVLFYKVIGGGHHWPGGTTDWTGGGNLNMDINASSEIWNFFKNFQNPLVDVAYTKSFELSRKYKYYSLQNDTLIVNARLANPKDHQVEVYAIIKADGSEYQDSLQLFDDALHNDGNASDNFFSGSKQLQNLEEDNYTVELKTHDLNMDKSLKFYLSEQFTTTGPLVLDSLPFGPIAGFRYGFKPYLKNLGILKTINNIKLKLSSNDSWITLISPAERNYPNIIPGQTTGGTQTFVVTYDSASFPGYFNLKFEISSNGIIYWIDSSTTVVTGIEDELTLPTDFYLEQNYPNPFNPTTKINYSIPKKSIVVIKVYDILSKEITTLLNEEKTAGTYELTWDAANLPSGVYFYQLRSGDFVETKKMLLMK